jgi:isochorismate pyruvate lyase
MATRAAQKCQSMEEVRIEIDRIDQALVDLICERFAYVDRAWQLKKSPADARVPWRIQQVIDKVKARASENDCVLDTAFGKRRANTEPPA